MPYEQPSATKFKKDCQLQETSYFEIFKNQFPISSVCVADVMCFAVKYASACIFSFM